MAVALMTARIADGDASAVSCAQVFTAATTAGAIALGRPDPGRIRAAAKADLAVSDLADRAFAPVSASPGHHWRVSLDSDLRLLANAP